MEADLLASFVAVGTLLGALGWGAIKFIGTKWAAEKSHGPAVAVGVAGGLVDRQIAERTIEMYEQMVRQLDRLNFLIENHSRETVVSTKRASEEMIELRKIMQMICGKAQTIADKMQGPGPSRR